MNLERPSILKHNNFVFNSPGGAGGGKTSGITLQDRHLNRLSDTANRLIKDAGMHRRGQASLADLPTLASDNLRSPFTSRQLSHADFAVMGSQIATQKSLQRERPAGLTLQRSLPNIEVLRTVQTPLEAQSAGLDKNMSFDFD